MYILVLIIAIRGGNMPFSARELLARLIKCEAGGEGDTGMKAVASVVMNRVNVPAGEYLRLDQGDLRKVILQPGQFTCAMTTVYGQPNPQNIWLITPDQQHYAAADWALSGNRISGLGIALWYFNPFKPTCVTYFPPNKTGVINQRIVQHCFYDPTPSYYKT